MRMIPIARPITERAALPDCRNALPGMRMIPMNSLKDALRQIVTTVVMPFRA